MMPWIKSCLCQQEKKKSPTISPPIHLLLKVRLNILLFRSLCHSMIDNEITESCVGTFGDLIHLEEQLMFKKKVRNQLFHSQILRML